MNSILECLALFKIHYLAAGLLRDASVALSRHPRPNIYQSIPHPITASEDNAFGILLVRAKYDPDICHRIPLSALLRSL